MEEGILGLYHEKILFPSSTGDIIVEFYNVYVV
jgi:hypothetical protein